MVIELDSGSSVVRVRAEDWNNLNLQVGTNKQLLNKGVEIYTESTECKMKGYLSVLD